MNSRRIHRNVPILRFFVYTKLDTEILNVQRLIFAIREMAALIQERVIS
jgi:hypothetical protein